VELFLVLFGGPNPGFCLKRKAWSSRAKKNVFFVVASLKRNLKMETSPMPTEGTKEKAAEGTNEGKPTGPEWPAALTDLPDELLTMVVKSVFKTGQVALAQLGGASTQMRARCVG
jgi:hypothetical protein